MSIEPQTGGGGWISGPSTTVPHRNLSDVEPLGSEIETGLGRHAADPRPEFSAEFMVAEVVRVLREHGVTIDPAPNQMFTAAVAAAQMLRALGVRAQAPERQP